MTISYKKLLKTVKYDINLQKRNKHIVKKMGLGNKITRTKSIGKDEDMSSKSQNRQIKSRIDELLSQITQMQIFLDPRGLKCKQKLYACKFCNSTFDKPTSLGGHISKTHKIKLKRKNQKKQFSGADIIYYQNHHKQQSQKTKILIPKTRLAQSRHPMEIGKKIQILVHQTIKEEAGTQNRNPVLEMVEM